MAAGDETLKGSRQLWLYNPMNFSAEQAASFAALRDSGLKVARAWAAKELFPRLWTYRYEGAARRFFKQWFGWVSRSRLKPLIKSNARGFRSFDNYRIRILFFCGKLDLYPL
jgi:transposase